MTTNLQVEINSRIQNLFRNLQKDPKSVFYLVGNLSKSVIKKGSKSIYEKDKIFVSLYKQLDDKNIQQKHDILPAVTPFINMKSNVDHPTLFSVLTYCMLILRILDFLQNLPLIQNIVCCWLIYLLRKYSLSNEK